MLGSSRRRSVHTGLRGHGSGGDFRVNISGRSRIMLIKPGSFVVALWSSG